MAGLISLLRRFLRNYFTRKYITVDDKPLAIIQNTTRKSKSRKNYRNVLPSEWFVWAMVVLIVALAGLVTIELTIILVTGAVNDAILMVISGLVGAVASRFLEAKR
jgi:hypothetical protein